MAPPYSGPHLERYPLIPEYQQAMREGAEASGAAFVALQPAFDARTEGDLYHEDGYHFSAAGHAVAADQIAPRIAQLLSPNR